MIIGSIADNNAVALTFGLVTAAAVACLIVVTAVTAPTAARTEERAEHVEELIQGLVSAGADEDDVRSLVREAVGWARSAGAGCTADAPLTPARAISHDLTCVSTNCERVHPPRATGDRADWPPIFAPDPLTIAQVMPI